MRPPQPENQLIAPIVRALTEVMDQRERALLAGLPDAGIPGWNGLLQNAVGQSMGRDEATVAHVGGGRGLLATIWAELSR